MPQNPCHALREAGTAVWLDQLSRELILQGKLKELTESAALTGLTSNPSIFHKAMTSGSAYDEQIRTLAGRSLTTEEFYEHLAIRDITLACDVLRPVWTGTQGADGYISLEVSPHLARDTEGTVLAARRLFNLVGRPNLLIKVPGTPEGLPAIERLLEEGIGINVTLLFAVDAYERVAETYLRVMGRRVAQNRTAHIPSVASFFISRIDTLIDKLLTEKAAEPGAAADEILALRGRAAVANAKIAYQSFQRIFGTPEFRRLQDRGARPQRPLWASTSTKNPDYRDVLYVEPLIGPDTVNTMPMETIEAFLDHGVVDPRSLTAGVDQAHEHIRRLEALGISFRRVTDQLLEEGISKFNESYDLLLAALEEKRSRG
jgi:transaldolase